MEAIWRSNGGELGKLTEVKMSDGMENERRRKSGDGENIEEKRFVRFEMKEEEKMREKI